MKAAPAIPCEIVFNPNWWFRNYGISFDRPFYFEPRQRVENDVRMRQVLYDRFGRGEAKPTPRPVVGSRHIAGGFVLPGLFGVEVRFAENQAPWNVPRNLTRQEIMALQVPHLETTWPMKEFITGMDALQSEWGYVLGDFNTGGLINTALELRGQELFLDLLEDRELTSHLFTVIAETMVQVASYVKARTGTTSVAVNRSIVNVDPAIHVNSNCSIQMISPALYRETIWPYELAIAARLRPFGIHHCGNNLQQYVSSYAQTGAVFYDVGWGSDVAACSRALLDAFLNLRLNPVRMLQLKPDDIRRDTLNLLAAAGRKTKVGVCCINMDYGTPDENVLAMFEAVAEFTRL